MVATVLLVQTWVCVTFLVECHFPLWEVQRVLAVVREVRPIGRSRHMIVLLVTITILQHAAAAVVVAAAREVLRSVPLEEVVPPVVAVAVAEVAQIRLKTIRITKEAR